MRAWMSSYPPLQGTIRRQAGFIPPVLHVPALKIASLFASSPIAGFFGYGIAKWKCENIDPTVIAGFHFWYTFLFAGSS
jgi:hypothetical protein